MGVIATQLIGVKDGYTVNRTKTVFQFQMQLDSLVNPAANVKAAAVAACELASGQYISNLDCSVIGRNGLWWQCDATVEIIPWGGSDPTPLMRPSILTSTYDETLDPYFKDAYGSLITNSAGDRFSEFPQRRNGKHLLQITKNFASFPALAYDAMKFTRNSVAVIIKGTSYDANTGLLLPVTVQEIIEQVGGVLYDYFSTTFRILIDGNYHEDLMEDRGFFQFTPGASTGHVEILGTDGHPLTTPWPLDGLGHAKPNATDAPPVAGRFPYLAINWGLSFD